MAIFGYRARYLKIIVIFARSDDCKKITKNVLIFTNQKKKKMNNNKYGIMSVKQFVNLHGENHLLLNKDVTPVEIKDARPLVGVSLLIVRDRKILLGKRKGAHGAGTWGCPGGHLEFGESFEDCVQRESLEETGLIIKSVKQVGVTNDLFFEKDGGKHYVTILMFSDDVEGEPKLLEPEKCEEWKLFDLVDLPKPLFLPIQNFFVSDQSTFLFKKTFQNEKL